MNKTSRLRAVLLLALLPALAGGQQEMVEPKDSAAKLLSRRVGWINAQSTEVVFALRMELGTAQVPGGIFAVRRCGVPEPTFVPAENSTLQDELNRIGKIMPEYRWTLDKGVLNFLPKYFAPSPLDIYIAEFKAENVSPLAAHSQLFEMEEVKSGLTRLGLHLPAVELVFGSGQSVKEEFRITINLKNTSLREALNAIVKADGRKTWMLSVYSCNGENTYQRVLVN